MGNVLSLRKYGGICHHNKYDEALVCMFIQTRMSA